MKLVGSEGQQNVIHTTIGDLVEALTDEAFKICRDNRQACVLAGLALEGILDRNAEWKNRKAILVMGTSSKTAA